MLTMGSGLEHFTSADGLNERTKSSTIWAIDRQRCLLLTKNVTNEFAK